MKGKKTGGRVAGTPNKITATVKESIEFVAQGLGGAEAYLEWAQSSPERTDTFWSVIYPKLLPKNMTVEGEARFRVIFETALGANKAQE